MKLPKTPVSRVVDPVIDAIGNSISWIWVVLMLVIVVNVCARYIFGEGRIEFEELQWHLYATGFLLAISYCVSTDSHIRVDVLHERFSERVQVWIDLYSNVLFVLPFVALMLVFGIPFVEDSFQRNEVSASPGGLPFRWIIKSMLVAGFALVGIATISRITRLAAYLVRNAS